MKKKIPFDVVEKAKKLGEACFTGDTFEVAEVVAGERCNNGGEYGFTSVFMRTSVPGVYHWTRMTTCDFDECGTGPQGYVVLTENMVVQILAASKRITDAAREAWMKYHWGNGDYPRYTGDSCESEIAAIIAAGNS